MFFRRANKKSIASSALEKLPPVERLSGKSMEPSETFLMPNQLVHCNLNIQTVGVERASSHSLPSLKHIDNNPDVRTNKHIDHNPDVRTNTNAEATPCFVEAGKLKLRSQYESSLFSSSLSDLFSHKLSFSSNNALYGHSVDTVAAVYEEEEVIESLDEMEAQTIGHLLPDDDDLFAGVTDGLDYNIHPVVGDDMDELELFSSVGGMDLEDDGASAGHKSCDFPGSDCLGLCNGSIVGQHPYGEHPSRTLFVRNINSNVEDSELKKLFELYGDIHTLYTACKHRGFVMISYYDLRDARNARKALQNKPLMRRNLDIHYSIPKENPSEKDVNQGTLVVFNLDSSVSNDELRQIFGVYGEIKEIREAPHRSHHKFIDFYDIRAAEAAHHALNRIDIGGKQNKLEPSRPGGTRRLGQHLPTDMEQDECSLFLQPSSHPVNSNTGFSVQNGKIPSHGLENGKIMSVHALETAFRHGISSSVPNGLSSMVRIESLGNQSGISESNHSLAALKFEVHGATYAFHPHSLPEYYDSLANGVHCNSPGLGSLSAGINARPPERIDNRQFPHLNSNSIELNGSVFGSGGSGSCSRPGHHYSWSNSYHPQPPGMMWPNSPSCGSGLGAAQFQSQLHGLPRAPSHILNPAAALPMTNHPVGSAPVVNPSLWGRCHSFAGESPKISGFHLGSLGNMRISSSPHSMEFVSHNVFPLVGGNMDLSIPSKSVGLQSHPQACMMFRGRSQIIPTINSFDPPNDRVRTHRNEGNSNQVDNKKQYELDIDRIMRGEDIRTTLMIKNIPNKYTSKMLLAAIDERHRGTYDFIYLPIDFKNKCNVGYAFINMTDPTLIVPFFQSFNGKKWEKFNSEKVASLAYARIQGKSALIAHFQNSSLMNEDKRCRPILFDTDGPNAGDQVPFPMGVSVRARPGKARTSMHDEIHQGSPASLDDLPD